MADSPEEVRKHLKLYGMIGVTLLVFTVITVLISYVDMGAYGVSALDIMVGLAIATFKATLVALIFMHLNSEKKTIYKFMLFTVVFFGAMMFLFLLAQSGPLNWPGFRNF